MIQAVALKTGASIRKICAVLGAARSSFYHASSPTLTQVADAKIGPLIEALFRHHRRRYGYRRLAQELGDRGVTCAPARIRRIMAQRGLHALQPKTFLPKTSDGRADKPSPNLLSGLPLPELPDRAWAGDITFIPTRAGWLYLAVVIDLCSRRIVGWSLADHMRSDLVLDALLQALQTSARQTAPSFTVTAAAVTGALSSEEGLRLKAGCAKACPHEPTLADNALHRVLHRNSQARNAPRRVLRECRRRSHRNLRLHRRRYNTHRKHSALGYKTPNQFEAQFHSVN